MAQPFGRFGYSDTWNVPGIVLEKDGFRTDFGAADKFHFTRPLQQWKPLSTSAMSQLVAVQSFAGSPAKLRQDLTAPGFSAYFDHGIKLRLTSNSPPIITWSLEGSMDATAELPTPALKWAIITFRDNQPPILLAFPWKTCVLKMWGKSGEWYVGTPTPWEGWMRVGAPTGISPRRTNTPAELGRMVQEFLKNESFWTQPPAALLDTKITDDDASVTVEWTFDRVGAVVPPPLYLSTLAGYQPTVMTKTLRIEAPTNDGPLMVTQEPKLTVRFPARRIPTGRILAIGNPGQALATASYLDPQSVVELALFNMFSCVEPTTRELSESTFGEFLSQTNYQKEPFTGQMLPYSPDGKGLDLTAAHALLMQSTISSTKASSEDNSLLKSVMLRRDWLTWRVWSPDSKISRRAASIAALASALAPESERRLDGALLEAGLAGEQGLGIWKKRTGLGASPPLLQCMETARADIYLPDDYRRKTGIGKVFLSDLRAYGNIPITLGSEQGGLYLTLTFAQKKNEVVTLASAFPIQVDPPTSGATVSVDQGFGLTVLTVTPSAVGAIKLRLTVPSWAALPTMPAEIRYEESGK